MGTPSLLFIALSAVTGAGLTFMGWYFGYWKGRIDGEMGGCAECGSCGHSGCCNGNTCKVMKCKYGGMYDQDLDSTGAEIGERINISDEVAAHVGYVKPSERVASGGNRPPESGVQSGVQHPEEGGKSA